MNYKDFDLSILDLDTPTSLNNSYYFSKFTNKNIILSLDSCIFNKKIELLKRGDSYVLLHFENNNLIDFLNKLEDSTCELILKKSQEWFENNVTLEDIKDSFNTNIKNNQVKFKLNSNVKDNIFVLNNINVDVDEFNSNSINNEFIPKIKLVGIKFNSNNFYLVLELLDMNEYKKEELNNLDSVTETTVNTQENNNSMIIKETLQDTSNNDLVLQDVQELPETQGSQDVQELSESPEAQDLQDVQELSEAQGSQDVHELSESPEAQDLQDVQELSEAQDLQHAKELSETPEAQDLQDVQELSETPETPEAQNLQDVQEPPESETQESPESETQDINLSNNENLEEMSKNNVINKENCITLEDNNKKEIKEINNLDDYQNNYVNETKNILKLNENRLLFYKLYVLFMEQIKTHQVDSILGKLEELNINYEKFIDFLNNEKDNYLSEEKFSL